MRRIAILILILFVLIGCEARKEEKEIQPFVGGQQGLEIDFLDLRKEVFDGGDDPFDVIVQLINRGEADVAQNDVLVTISGIRSQEFNKAEDDLRKNPPEDIPGLWLDPEGNVIPSGPAFVEFMGLNHVSSITGTAIPFPLRADVCYKYGTTAVSKLCVRKNLVSPAGDGICEISEVKRAFNSGAPVHVENIRETAQGKNKIRLTFDIKHVGTGNIHQPGGQCELERQKNKVVVTVDTGMPGLSCTGLNPIGGTAVEGTATLFDGIKTIQCTQNIPKPKDFEQPIEIKVGYNYQESKQVELLVKNAGEE